MGSVKRARVRMTSVVRRAGAATNLGWAAIAFSVLSGGADGLAVFAVGRCAFAAVDFFAGFADVDRDEVFRETLRAMQASVNRDSNSAVARFNNHSKLREARSFQHRHLSAPFDGAKAQERE